MFSNDYGPLEHIEQRTVAVTLTGLLNVNLVGVLKDTAYSYRFRCASRTTRVALCPYLVLSRKHTRSAVVTVWSRVCSVCYCERRRSSFGPVFLEQEYFLRSVSHAVTTHTLHSAPLHRSRFSRSPAPGEKPIFHTYTTPVHGTVAAFIIRVTRIFA